MPGLGEVALDDEQVVDVSLAGDSPDIHMHALLAPQLRKIHDATVVNKWEVILAQGKVARSKHGEQAIRLLKGPELVAVQKNTVLSMQPKSLP